MEFLNTNEMRIEVKAFVKAYRLLFKRRALRVWLIIIFMLIIYIPIVVNIVYIHNQTIEVVRREKKESIQNKLYKVRESINFVTNEIQENSNELIAHLGLRKSIQDFEKLDEERKESIQRFILGKIEELVEKSGGYVKEAFIITEEGEFLKLVGSELVERANFVQSWFLRNARRKDSNTLWQIVSGEKLYEKTEQEKNLILTEKIYDIDEQSVIGIFVVVLENDNFYNLYGDTVSHYSGKSEIYDSSFKPLSLGILDGKLHLSVYDKQRLANQEQVSMKIGSVDYVIVNEYLDILDWRLVSLVPEEELVLSIQKELRRSLILVLLVSAIVAAIIAFEITVVSSAVAEKEKTRYKLNMSEEVNEKLSMYKHDFANHIQIVRGMIELGHTKRAVKYLKDMGYESLEIKERTDTGVPEIEAVLATAYAAAKKEGIEIEIITRKIHTESNARIYDLLKVVNNLIKNAIESLSLSKNNDKKLTIFVDFVLDEYVFEISNNVPLICEKEREAIFTKGYTTKQRGSGLGLYIVKKLLEKNQGTVNLVVDENGNHFEVRYPS